MEVRGLSLVRRAARQPSGDDGAIRTEADISLLRLNTASSRARTPRGSNSTCDVAAGAEAEKGLSRPNPTDGADRGSFNQWRQLRFTKQPARLTCTSSGVESPRREREPPREGETGDGAWRSNHRVLHRGDGVRSEEEGSRAHFLILGILEITESLRDKESYWISHFGEVSVNVNWGKKSRDRTETARRRWRRRRQSAGDRKRAAIRGVRRKREKVPQEEE